MAAEQALAEAGVEAMVTAQAFDAAHARIGSSFPRREMRERARRYLRGVLDRVERKNSWQLAEALGERGPQGVHKACSGC